MKNILLLVLFLSAHLCCSQSKQVTIIGNMPQQYGGEYLSFSKPIGKYTTESSYINSKDNAVIINDKFIKTLDIAVPGIIYVYEKPFNGIISTRFFAEPGDTIILERQNGEIIFKGKNAIVNKMYSDVKLGHVAFNDEVYDIFKNTNDADKILSKINNKEKIYLQHYNELFLKKQISKSCLEYTKVLMEQSIDGLALGIARDEEFRKEQKMLITKEGANKIVDYIVLKYIPYKEENLRSLFFLGLMKKSASYLEKQSLKENKKITRFWNQFDTIFKSETKNLGVIDYLESDDYKETAIGQYFLSLIKNYDNEKSIKYKDLIMVYKAFVEKFPNSPYIIPLSESIMNAALDNLSTSATNVAKSEPNTALGNLAIYGTTLETVGTAPFAQPNQSLADVLAEKFPTQDLFVDLWATWCGPCLMQFPYNKDLHSFLETKNIKTLYVSQDKEEDITKWQKYIQDYNLTGYHFLADKAYVEKFINPLTAYIPRYFIYDSKTKKLKPLEGYPKEKEKFYTQIAKALPTKQ
ncbi:redoxin family protein [Flavobacterium sp. Fl-318]|uniref:Redoxin family protein n=1 Tax=Flavobacterium cupriresistens TaxID=2893885 RepID=A0ABU4R5H2_9FLAO|nr:MULTISPECIES: redoxin family protein [unclassified Flavobacterium]MDX6187829.1 redoxin family protein [Flavobacterium sp. Fl-318]UFH42249.1 redoxin family protein [Flavobacterium sp. F-323]